MRTVRWSSCRRASGTWPRDMPARSALQPCPVYTTQSHRAAGAPGCADLYAEQMRPRPTAAGRVCPAKCSTTSGRAAMRGPRMPLRADRRRRAESMRSGKSGPLLAPPLQIAGVQSERDGAHHQIKHHRLRADQSADEVDEMLSKRHVAEQAAEQQRRLKALQMPDEPEAEQHRHRDQRGDDLIVR